MNTQPPKWAIKFLHWYCNPDLIEEIEGDIYEIYDRNVKNGTIKKAKINFVWNVIRFFRYSNIIRSNSIFRNMNQLTLFKSYLKIGFRNIKKHWVTSLINVFGLSIAIGLAVTVFIFLDVQFNWDKFHANSERIYQITNYVQEETDEVLWGDSLI